MSIRRRLQRLEDVRGERAVERVRAFWRGLTVEECALVCAWASADEAGEEAPPGAVEIAAREREEVDAALRVAIGWREGMREEEEIARTQRLLEGVDYFDGRGHQVRRRYLELTGADAT